MCVLCLSVDSTSSAIAYSSHRVTSLVDKSSFHTIIMQLYKFGSNHVSFISHLICLKMRQQIICLLVLLCFAWSICNQPPNRLIFASSGSFASSTSFAHVKLTVNVSSVFHALAHSKKLARDLDKHTTSLLLRANPTMILSPFHPNRKSFAPSVPVTCNLARSWVL